MNSDVDYLVHSFKEHCLLALDKVAPIVTNSFHFLWTGLMTSGVLMTQPSLCCLHSTETALLRGSNYMLLHGDEECSLLVLFDLSAA